MTRSSAMLQTDHVSDYGRWTLYRRKPCALLAPYVDEMQGYFEEGGASIIRKEVPSGVVPLILIFGPGFTLQDPRRPGQWRALDRSFVAGLHHEHVLVGSRGEALCMQVDFTPWGARRFLGVDMGDLTDRVVNLNDVTGAFADLLEEQLAGLDTWEARFDIVERAIAERIMGTSAESLLTRAAWDILQRSHGEARIGDIARDLDCSRKHLVSLFHREVGLPPKTLARVLRFERALAQLSTGSHTTLADLAMYCGYADQAHFNRDFAAFAGESPRALRERMLPDGTGIMADER